MFRAKQFPQTSLLEIYTDNKFELQKRTVGNQCFARNIFEMEEYGYVLVGNLNELVLVYRANNN